MEQILNSMQLFWDEGNNLMDIGPEPHAEISVSWSFMLASTRSFGFFYVVPHTLHIVFILAELIKLELILPLLQNKCNFMIQNLSHK